MDFFQIMQVIIAILIIFFLTGYLIINKFFKELSILEKIVLTIGVSLCISILIGVFLGSLGIFNFWNSILSYLVIIIIILVLKK